ncbi:MAG: amino acid-binding protein [Oscillospiraceae bacterium]|nr:amino acid-binding protein [Oscillospiraceae bacterium]
MMIQQLSVFLENRAGQLSAVTELLAQNHVDMQALNIAETADYGVLRLIVDMPQRAARLLRDNGFIVRETPVVQAPVSDKPGGLNAVLNSIAAADIDIEYMYSGMSQKNGLAYMIFRVSEPEKLDRVLTGLV